MNRVRQAAYRLVLLQVIVSIVIAGVLWELDSFQQGYSALLGGLVCAAATACFAKRVFRMTGARAAPQIVMSFYSAEVMKLMLTVVLFGLIMKYVAIAPLPFFMTYIGTQLMLWFAPLLFKNSQKVFVS